MEHSDSKPDNLSTKRSVTEHSKRYDIKILGPTWRLLSCGRKNWPRVCEGFLPALTVAHTPCRRISAGLDLGLLNVHTPLCSEYGLSSHQVINVSSSDVCVLSEPQAARTVTSQFIFLWIDWQTEEAQEKGDICMQWVNVSVWQVQSVLILLIVVLSTHQYVVYFCRNPLPSFSLSSLLSMGSQLLPNSFAAR